MKKRKLLPLFFTFFVALLLMQCDNKAETQNPSFIHYEDQIDSTQYYSYKIDFPDTLYYSNLAKAMKNYATAARDTFFAMMPKDTASLRLPWELIVDFNKELESPRFVGFLAEYYRYTGGAHGIPATRTFVFDKRNKQLVALKDLFSDSTAIAPISQYVRNVIARKVYGRKSFQNLDSSNQDWVRQGTTPEFKYYSTFLPVSNSRNGLTGIKIIFQHYQVAPYAAGRPAVVIPADKFYRYLAPEYKKVFIQNK